MTNKLFGGVDTHTATHHAAVIDGAGRLIDTRQFAATTAGYESLRQPMVSRGHLARVGVDRTGT